MSNVRRQNKPSEQSLDALSRILLASFLAVVLSVLSAFIERTGPEVASYGNMCGPAANDPCLKPLLKGGLPIAYLFDQPGVSVEHQLTFAEDQVLIGAFALNTALYFAAIVLVARLLRKDKSR